MPVRTTRALHRATLIAVVLGVTACSDTSAPPDGGGSPAAEVPINLAVNVGGQDVAGVSVEVTGPGIGTSIVANLALDATTFKGTLKVPAGSNRSFHARAFDAKGTETHQGTTVADVSANGNTAVHVTLYPRLGGVPIEATLSTYTVTLTLPPATLAVGQTVQATAAVTGLAGPIANATLEWGTLNPGVATVSGSGVVTGAYPGQTTVVASYQGIAAAAPITVESAPAGTP